ncbi:MAG TPA: hypothetical protein PK014_00630 [Thermoanaerobaculia bacterium]|nr:hypothetical protein [Thermoanaerobaculia bacterium]HXK66977.1 hypothetical protein [Thermoanaerobaculia bacterium]
MENCKMLEGCLFFHDKLEAMPSTAMLLKEKYCLKAYEDCARYRVATTLGREKVPGNLFPGQTDRADQILKSAGH